MATISKALFAKKLGVAKSTVSRYVAMGMPVTVDGRVDPELAAAWVRKHVKLQSGRRGVGVRAALGASRRNGVRTNDDPIREQIRLTRLRADKIEREIALLRGGTDSERARRLAETVALRAWWCFQRAAPAALAYAIAARVGQSNDKQFMYSLANVIAQRDEIIMRDILHELRDGIGGHIEPRDNPLVGASWLEGRPTA
jgi:hypothetical protein